MSQKYKVVFAGAGKWTQGAIISADEIKAEGHDLDRWLRHKAIVPVNDETGEPTTTLNPGKPELMPPPRKLKAPDGSDVPPPPKSDDITLLGENGGDDLVIGADDENV